MEYKYLSLMSDSEVRIILINYANQTGIEMNNYLIRQLISLLRRNLYHSILVKMDFSIKQSSIYAITKEVKEYISSYRFNLSESLLILMIRENKNSIYMNESKGLKDTCFFGVCEHHGKEFFSIRGDNYFCYECNNEKMNNVLYNPVRNLILKEFIDSYKLKKVMISDELKITKSHIDRYYSYKSPISNKRWDSISKLIKSINEQEVNKNESFT